MGSRTQGVINLYCTDCPGSPRHERIAVPRFIDIASEHLRDVRGLDRIEDLPPSVQLLL